MHAEDYVHRIGRTGRAHAIGDAISFASPEDMSFVRSLEKFIGRGITRKRAEGFNYNVPVPAGVDEMRDRDRRDTRRSQPQGQKNQENRPRRPQLSGQGGSGGGGGGGGARPPQRPARPQGQGGDRTSRW
jgi:ATP-dependent RNA helicase RhlE